jgi:hypothetical protein
VDVTPFWQRHLCALAVHDGEYSAKKTGKVEWSTHKQLHLIASPPLTYAGGLAQGRVLGRDLLFPSDLAASVAESALRDGHWGRGVCVVRLQRDERKGILSYFSK